MHNCVTSTKEINISSRVNVGYKSQSEALFFKGRHYFFFFGFGFFLPAFTPSHFHTFSGFLIFCGVQTKYQNQNKLAFELQSKITTIMMLLMLIFFYFFFRFDLI